MSFLKSFAVFLLSTIFVFSLTIVITGYFTKDIINENSITNFIKTEIGPVIINNQCSQACANVTSQLYQTCINKCSTTLSNQLENFNLSTLTNVYQPPTILGLSMLDLLNLLDLLNNNLILITVITALSAVGIIFLAKEPLKTLGHNLTSVGISTTAIGVLPRLFVVPSDPLIAKTLEYFFTPLEQLLYVGIIVLSLGIGLRAASYIYEKRKKST